MTVADRPAALAHRPRPRDRLVAGVFDLSGGRWFSDGGDRVARALLPGKAGDVRGGEVPGGYLAARRAGVLARPPRMIRADWQAQEDGAYVVFIGSLYDREELCTAHQLDSAGSDADIYAALHRRLGERCDAAVNGDYAVVQWFPADRRVRMARSPISSHPLHLWRQGDRVVVASLPRALFAMGAPRRVDDAKLADCLMLNLSQQSDSWFRDLERSHPGTITIIDQSGRRSSRFWSLDDVAPVRFKRDADYVDAVGAAFAKAVRETVGDARKPALFLSGGFDSQAVASYLVEVLPANQRIPAYTSVPMAGYRDAGGADYFADESAHVRALAAMYPRIDPEFIEAAGAPLNDRLDEVTMLGSWPIHNPMALHWSNEALRRAALEGCDIMLDGSGGNATFSYDGEGACPTWFRRGRWLRLWNALASDGQPRPTWRKVMSQAIRPNMPVSLQFWWKAMRGYPVPRFPAWSALREDFARESGAIDRARAAGFDWRSPPFRSSAAIRTEWLAIATTEGAEMTTAFDLMFGVEQRDPTVYRPFMELCFGIPDEQYLRGGTDRWLARRLLRGRVPEMVRTERRSGMQNADWPARFARERGGIEAELDAIERDDRLAAMLDVPRMRRAFADWPGEGPRQSHAAAENWLAMARGIATARFVRHAEGRNVG